MTDTTSNHSRTVEPVDGEGDQFRCDVYSRVGKLLRSFDITAIPVIDFEEIVRSAMGNDAKVAHIVQHEKDVLLGRRIAEVMPPLHAVPNTPLNPDRFNSRRALTGVSW